LWLSIFSDFKAPKATINSFCSYKTLLICFSYLGQYWFYLPPASGFIPNY
jgi:hypothetical protein